MILLWIYFKNKEAIKKLENVKKDHEKRIEELQRSQVYFFNLYISILIHKF